MGLPRVFSRLLKNFEIRVSGTEAATRRVSN